MIQSNYIRLEEVAQEYFGLSVPVAKRKAALYLLPVPAFRLNNSTKGPLFINKDSLQQYVESRENHAKQMHEKMAMV